MRQLVATSWAEAATAVASGAVPVAGGTGVQPWLNGGARPALLVHLARIPGAGEVEVTDGTVTVGAMTPVDHPALCRWFGAEGPLWFATPATRRRATAVGNLVSPLGPRELGPLLTALGGWVSFASGIERPVPAVAARAEKGGAVATGLRARLPERVVYERVSLRPRLSRVEAGLAAALGEGCGAALVVGTAGTPVPLPVNAEVSRPDFVAAARAMAPEGSADLVAGLAARAHQRLHGGRG